MARKKVKLHYIENDTARRVTYKKRVKGVLKKTQELSVLCGVDVCTVVYGPYDQAPIVWPSSETEASRILMEFRRKPDIDQTQRKFTQETFLRQTVTKSEERLLRLQRRNREMEMENITSQLLGGTPIQQVPFGDLGDLIWVIEDKLRTIQHRIRVLDGPDNHPTNAANPGINPVLNLVNSLEIEVADGVNAMIDGIGSVSFKTQANPSQFQPQPC
ncbi:hypothetical protein RND81_12G077700 [Saponaria officinalis]|uniref:MADS-box domain-containing protein n=1 Tax=Saponaria officinalis TaxID=3572 RepID=A0AAW1H7V9_SAPOF